MTVNNQHDYKALEKNIESVVYDRGGYIYHGVVKELAEAAREAGLEFQKGVLILMEEQAIELKEKVRH